MLRITLARVRIKWYLALAFTCVYAPLEMSPEAVSVIELHVSIIKLVGAVRLEQSSRGMIIATVECNYILPGDACREK